MSVCPSLIHIALSRQQRLRERSSILRSSYIACLVKYCKPFSHTTLQQSTVPLRCLQSATDFCPPDTRSVPMDAALLWCKRNAERPC